ncbi:MAG TPA: class I SAM-dependent methyltransferase [Noviherbaspirillum sp.]
MKGRESGMPDESYWSSFFQPDGMLERLLPANHASEGHIVEFGCGYGTFTLPAARRTNGLVTALDIEPDMVELVSVKARAAGLHNVCALVRDFVEHGTGLRDTSQEHAMVFNLLHLEEPVALLREAHRTLQPGGTLSVIHWRSDIDTPRGPPLSIRPGPEQCMAWMRQAGFGSLRKIDFAADAPYHFGLVGLRE